MKKNMVKQAVVVLLVGAMTTTMVGCYGSFSLIKKVYNWNGKMGGKIEKELVFLGLNIIPVYGIAGFIDVVILNSIQFWTGTNPMASVIKSDDGTVVSFNDDKKEMIVVYSDKKFVLVNENGKAIVKDGDGKFIASAISDANGTINIVDENGQVLGTYSSQEVSEILELQ